MTIRWPQVVCPEPLRVTAGLQEMIRRPQMVTCRPMILRSGSIKNLLERDRYRSVCEENLFGSPTSIAESRACASRSKRYPTGSEASCCDARKRLGASIESVSDANASCSRSEMSFTASDRSIDCSRSTRCALERAFAHQGHAVPRSFQGTERLKHHVVIPAVPAAPASSQPC
jgi:hypothetical protein